MATATHVTPSEALQIYANWAGDVLNRLIPEDKRMEMVLQRMAGEVDHRREDYQKALAAVCQLRHPDTGEGEIKVLEDRLQLYDAQGKKWTEQQAQCTPGTPAFADLEAKLNALDQRMTDTEAELDGKRANLKIAEETLAIQQQRYESARADYENLHTLAPILVAQINAKKQLVEERNRAQQAAGRHSTVDPQALVKELQTELAEVDAQKAASDVIEGQEQPLDIDAAIADENRQTALSERRRRWATG
jgi:hypothetical protein